MKTVFLLAPGALALFTGASLLVGTDLDSSSGTTDTTPAPAVVDDTSAPDTTRPEPIPEVKIATAPAELSPEVEEVVQLARARVGEEVMLAYVQASTNAFQLSADEIIYLHDVGVSAEVVAAMVRHGQLLREREDSPADLSTESVAEVAAAAAEPSADEVEPKAAEAVAAEPPPAAAETAAAPEAPADRNQQVTYNYFYNTLSPYGSWIEVDGYGWCWQPTVAVVNPGWQPYCDNGRWIYTDSGWYWSSYYSWGWAPFHYGRWHRHRHHGWVWYPGTVWGPAWVTWRYYDGYCGWAPLPPACGYVSGVGLTYYGSRVSFSFGFGLGWNCYSYVPIGRFYCADPWRYRVHRSHGIHVHNNSTVINNYVTGNNNTTIINVGPGTSTIAAATRTEIRKVTIQDSIPTGNTTIRADQLSRDGRTLAVYRPKLPQQASTPPSNILRRQEQVGKQTEAIANSPAARRAADRVREEGLTKPRRLDGSSTSSTSADIRRSEPALPSNRAGTAPSGKPTYPPTAARTEVRGNSSVARPTPTNPSARPELTKPRSVPNSPAASPPRYQPQPKPVSPSPITRPAPRSESVAPKPRVPERSSFQTPKPSQTPTRAPSPTPKPRSESSRPVSPIVSPKPRVWNTPSVPAPKPAAVPSSRPTPSRPAFQPSSPRPAPRPAISPPRYSAPAKPAPQPSRNYSPAPAPRAPAPSSRSFSSPSSAAPRSMPSPPPSSFSKGSRGR